MEQTNWTRHYLMRSLILAGFAALLSYLIWTEKLGHYLAPKLHMLSYVTLGILVILTIVSVRQLFSKTGRTSATARKRTRCRARAGARLSSTACFCCRSSWAFSCRIKYWGAP